MVQYSLGLLSVQRKCIAVAQSGQLAGAELLVADICGSSRDLHFARSRGFCLAGDQRVVLCSRRYVDDLPDFRYAAGVVLDGGER